MHLRAILVLALLLFVTSFYIVKTRHDHRLAYNRLQQTEARHDQLVDEWGQLLTEMNLWSFPHRIEKDAAEQLDMQKPVAQDVIYIDLEREPAVDSLAQSAPKGAR